MNSMNCVLSVVIPAYNVEGFIRTAIQSALNQTIYELEVIVIDDGSTDYTLKRINSIQDPRLKVFTQKNLGLSAARNLGIRMSNGKYIGFLDGDDTWFPLKAELHISTQEKNRLIGITYDYLAYIDEQDHFTGQYLITRVNQPSISDLMVRNYIMASAIVRKACFSEAGLFDEELFACEDYEMWLRIYNKTNYKARLIPKVLTGYRVRSSSLTMNFELFLKNAKKAITKVETDIPGFTKKKKNRALAEIYRIAGRKALSSGQIDRSAQLMKNAVHYCPLIVCSDLRALGTLILINLESLLPISWRHVFYRLARKMMKIFYHIYIPLKEKFL